MYFTYFSIHKLIEKIKNTFCYLANNSHFSLICFYIICERFKVRVGLLSACTLKPIQTSFVSDWNFKIIFWFHLWHKCQNKMDSSWLVKLNHTHTSCPRNISKCNHAFWRPQNIFSSLFMVQMHLYVDQTSFSQ